MNIRLFLICSSVFAAQFLIAQNPVKIGLLIQDKNERAALNGAELAVKIANENNGVDGRQLILVTKSMEGTWGTGSKQAVDLIWNEEVCVLLGSHDGRNAHLVEQASAKSITPFVSVWSSDPTLSQAFIPWFFNCVPNDEQQAVALVEEIFFKKGHRKILVITDDAYDSKMAFKNFVRQVRMNKMPDPITLFYNDINDTPQRFISLIQSDSPECIVLLSGPEISIGIVRQLDQYHINKPVYGSLQIMNENRMSDEELKVLQQKVLNVKNDWIESSDFERRYTFAYGRKPGLVAAFAYDGMNAIIEALRRAKSTEREKIQEALYQIQFKGITGTVQFGQLGVRLNSLFISSL